MYRVDERSGSMHGKKFLVQEVHFGSDGANFYLRVDFHSGLRAGTGRHGSAADRAIAGWHAAQLRRHHLRAGSAGPTETRLAAPVEAQTGKPVESALGRVLEVRVALKAMGIPAGNGLRFQCSLWHSGLPIDAVPQQGWLEMPTTNPAEMTG